MSKQQKGDGSRLKLWLGQFRDRLFAHYPILLSSIGAGLLALVSVNGVQKYSSALWAIGVALTFFGFFAAREKLKIAAFYRRENRQLRRDVRILTHKLDGLRHKRIFLITADLSQGSWQVPFVRQLLFALRQGGFRVDTYVQSATFNPAGQDEHLESVISQREDYAGGIVISMFPEKRKDALEAFAATLKRPLVIVDNIFHGAIDFTAYVGVKSADTGALAAEAVLDVSETRSIKRILVIAGHEQAERQQRFTEIVGAKLGVEPEILSDGEFSRTEAHRLTLLWIPKAWAECRPYDLIFCTSDEMTLGCVDALGELSSRGSGIMPLVVGHDGIESVVHLIKIGNPYVARVVVTDPEAMATDTVHTLRTLLNTGVPPQPYWCRPFLYPSRFVDPRGSRQRE